MITRSITAVLVILVGVAGCSGGVRLDDRATAVRERLGKLCSSFDFQSKAEINGGEYRPVDCKTDEGVTLRILVFQDLDHLRDSWRDVPEAADAVASGPPGPIGVGVEEDAATVVVYDRSLIDDVRARLFD
jgi:hypothetical protein